MRLPVTTRGLLLWLLAAAAAVAVAVWTTRQEAAITAGLRLRCRVRPDLEMTCGEDANVPHHPENWLRLNHSRAEILARYYDSTCLCTYVESRVLALLWIVLFIHPTINPTIKQIKICIHSTRTDRQQESLPVNY